MHFFFSDKVVLLFDFWNVHSPAGKSWEAFRRQAMENLGSLYWYKPDSSCINSEWELCISDSVCSHCLSDCKGLRFLTDPHKGPERGQGCSFPLSYREGTEGRFKVVSTQNTECILFIIY